MTLREWLAARTPAPPAPLLERVQHALRASDQLQAGDAPAQCIEAAERILRDLLRDGRDSREDALDLLAADALATYAFEAAADQPELLDVRAAAAMQRFAAAAMASAE